jgi:hypothetical protein
MPEQRRPRRWRRSLGQLQVRRLLRRGRVLVPFFLSGSRQLVVTTLAPRFLDVAVVDRLLKKAFGAGFIETQTLGEFGERWQACRQSRVVKRHVRPDSVQYRYGRGGGRHARDCSSRSGPSQLHTELQVRLRAPSSDDAPPLTMVSWRAALARHRWADAPRSPARAALRWIAD